MSVLWPGIKRARASDDAFFELGDATRKVYVESFANSKTSNANALATQLQSVARSVVRKYFHCGIRGCVHRCYSLAEFDSHYQLGHHHQCSVCQMRLRTRRFLDLHFQERHDPYFKVQAEKQRMFECLVDNCGRKFNTRKGRHLHLVDFHKYPRSFRFEPLRRRRHLRQSQKVPEKSSMDTTEETPTEEMDVESSTQSTSRVPTSLSFGRQRRYRGKLL